MMIILLRTTIIGGCMDKVIRYITHDEECWLCGGTGELEEHIFNSQPPDWRVIDCYDCDGKGIVAGTTYEVKHEKILEQ